MTKIEGDHYRERLICWPIKSFSLPVGWNFVHRLVPETAQVSSDGTSSENEMLIKTETKYGFPIFFHRKALSGVTSRFTQKRRAVAQSLVNSHFSFFVETD